MPPTLTFSEQVLAFAVAVPALYLIATAFGRVLKRRLGVRIGASYQFLALVLAVYLPMLWLRKDYGPHPYNVQNDLGAAAILLGSLVGLALLRRYLWELYFAERRGMAIPKLLQQVFAVIVFCVALLAVAYWVYGFLPTGVQLTSTVVVGVVGLAMQSLLGNVVAGVSLQMGKPFVSGDWLVVDDQHAEVIEINWRSTRLRTTDDYHLDVPNSKIVSSTIVNLSYPSHLHAMRMRVGIIYEAPPNQVKAVLMQAVRATADIHPTPPPKVFLVDFADSSMTYEIKYWINNHARANEISDALRTNVWYGLKRAGIPIPFPIRTVQLERKRTEQPTLPGATRALISQKAFFECLSEEQTARIIDSARISLFGLGEKIVEQGEEGDSMFVLLKGRAEVYVRAPEGTAEAAQVATLQAGDYFGEMSLLTGEKRSATVVAGADCEVLEITKPHLAPMLQENAELRQNLSEMLARRRMENEGLLASAAGKQAVVEKEKEYAARFLARLASFFEL